MNQRHPLLRRVAVTGIGAVTPLGVTFLKTWNNLMEEKNGASTLESAIRAQGLPDAMLEKELERIQQLPCGVACPVKNFEPYNARTSRFVQFALEAGRDALQSAKLEEWFGPQDSCDSAYETRRQRAGACIGSGMSSVREISEATRTVDQSGFRKLSPHFVPKVLTNSAAGRLCIEYKLQGPNHSASTACAASSHSIGDTVRCIQYDNADIMLAGGAEACIDYLSVAGFCRLRALSTRADIPPDKASRPFDKSRDGFVMAEGAAVLVLEELEHAKKRQAHILAEIIGYGLTADAYHITAPEPNGRGAERAMRMALDHAGLSIMDVDYVNAHATSTPLGDEIEARVIDRTFSSTDRQVPLYVSSTKGATGHLLGAAGAIEAAFAVQALAEQRLPPTLNLQETDEKVSFQHVTTTLDGVTMNHAISNSFGFGGTNASLLFRRYEGQ